MIITIFTATFNRAYLIKNLYTSLCLQTNKDFEWIIIDDGSIDDTHEVIRHFIDENILDIKYIKQQNNGKHIAINKGVTIAEGKLFFIVDSDDKLPEDSVLKILELYKNNKNRTGFAGIAGRKAYFDNQVVGSKKTFQSIYCNALDIRYKYKIKGDLAEVFLTLVLQKYPFPEIENEKFCPEALVWNRIAQKYSLLYFPETIYQCEYNDDGLTAKIIKIRMDSPIASMSYYSELFQSKIPFTEKIKAVINFWRFSFGSDASFYNKMKFINHQYSLIFFPVGWLFYRLDIIKQK